MADHPPASRLRALAVALLDRRARLTIAWLAVLVGTAIGVGAAWTWGDVPERRDGNHGHAEIDFGGQWAMARMIVEGQGRHLYDRNRIREVLEKAYPQANEAPTQDLSDVDNLIGGMLGHDAPEPAQAAASVLTPLAARTPLGAVTLLEAGQPQWRERLALVTVPQRGGALYPPVQALLFAPLACLPPLPAYRVMQFISLVLTFAAGWALCRISGGRVWWPIATLAFMIFPGYGGSLNIGQNAMFSAALVVLGWWAFTEKQEVLGGICWGLLAYKPVWAVSFLPVLLLTQRWRAALAMACTGGGLALLTVPIVGWHSWFDWLAIGQEGSRGYATFKNWVFLSRDLMGIPRRYLFDFDEYVALNPDAPLPTWIGHGMQLGVAGTALFVALRRPVQLRAPTGPGAAFALLSGWLCCLHFMYYDVLLAALPVYLLFTDPLHDFLFPLWREGRDWSLVLKLFPVVVLVLISSLAQIGPLLAPSWMFPPFDTFGLVLLWGWCGWQVLRARADEA